MQIDLKLPFKKRNKNVCVSHCRHENNVKKKKEKKTKRYELTRNAKVTTYQLVCLQIGIFFAFTCGLIVYVIRHLSYSNGSNIHTRLMS